MRLVRELRHSGTLQMLPVLGLLVLSLSVPPFSGSTISTAMRFIDIPPEHLVLYGRRHFNAVNSSQYDIEKAKFFFSEALKQNPSLPLVRHELGRIAFLEGDFGTAISYLDEEIIRAASPDPATFYVRALVRAYVKDYPRAAEDYESYFAYAPANWGALNDYAWVLMQQGNLDDALHALNWGLSLWPQNAWLLTNKATALYEKGNYADAAASIRAAEDAVSEVTVTDWLSAYPGNDPRTGEQGLSSFRRTVVENRLKIQEAQAVQNQ